MKATSRTETFETQDHLTITVVRGKDYAERDGDRVFIDRDYTIELGLPPGFRYKIEPPTDSCLHKGKLYLYFDITREKEARE